MAPASNEALDIRLTSVEADVEQHDKIIRHLEISVARLTVYAILGSGITAALMSALMQYLLKGL